MVDKIRPRDRRRRGFDFGPVVVDVATTMEPIHVETVEGELTLKDSPWDPVARYLPMAGDASAMLVTHQMKSREITNAGHSMPIASGPTPMSSAEVAGPARTVGPRRTDPTGRSTTKGTLA